ncbi:hypothetical protein ABK040_012910 [Willaertia magna]
MNYPKPNNGNNNGGSHLHEAYLPNNDMQQSTNSRPLPPPSHFVLPPPPTNLMVNPPPNHRMNYHPSQHYPHPPNHPINYHPGYLPNVYHHPPSHSIHHTPPPMYYHLPPTHSIPSPYSNVSSPPTIPSAISSNERSTPVNNHPQQLNRPIPNNYPSPTLNVNASPYRQQPNNTNKQQFENNSPVKPLSSPTTKPYSENKASILPIGINPNNKNNHGTKLLNNIPNVEVKTTPTTINKGTAFHQYNPNANKKKAKKTVNSIIQQQNSGNNSQQSISTLLPSRNVNNNVLEPIQPRSQQPSPKVIPTPKPIQLTKYTPLIFDSLVRELITETCLDFIKEEKRKPKETQTIEPTESVGTINNKLSLKDEVEVFGRENTKKKSNKKSSTEIEETHLTCDHCSRKIANTTYATHLQRCMNGRGSRTSSLNTRSTRSRNSGGKNNKRSKEYEYEEEEYQFSGDDDDEYRPQENDDEESGSEYEEQSVQSKRKKPAKKTVNNSSNNGNDKKKSPSRSRSKKTTPTKRRKSSTPSDNENVRSYENLDLDYSPYKTSLKEQEERRQFEKEVYDLEEINLLPSSSSESEEEPFEKVLILSDGLSTNSDSSSDKLLVYLSDDEE